MYSIQSICSIIGGRWLNEADLEITHLLYDSRRVQQPAASLFFAIKTGHNDGHRYLAEAYEKGVRAFVVSEDVAFENAAVIRVDDTLQAWQELVAYHRSGFQLPVVGVTGSNGKTIVKEWLNLLLEEDYVVVRSPKSFNSQIGVPLSVWEIGPQHTLGIFEAGISQPGEMEKLAKIIQPTIGVLTNLGEAHSEGFASDKEKLSEKLRLFANAEIIIGPKELLKWVNQPTFTWSRSEVSDVLIHSVETSEGKTTIQGSHGSNVVSVVVPFSNDASIENCISCLCVLLYLKVDAATYNERFAKLHAVDMRLQLHRAINGCLLINDSYSADLTSLRIALHFLDEQSSGKKRTVILSDFVESGKTDTDLYAGIAQLLKNSAVEKLITVGNTSGTFLKDFLPPSVSQQHFSATKNFIQQFRTSQFADEIVLLKGARRFGFERIAALFEQKLHGTVLQINLSALAHNLKQYQKYLRPDTKIMAMVKAFSYGSGGAEIASVLEYHNVAYLGVAYADEGIELVQSGISLPVMVMNAEASSYAAIVDHDLQPVIYSQHLLREFEDYVKRQGLTNYPVHLEVETGMNRLGFALEEMESVASHFASNTNLHIETLFSHLAASEDQTQDAFTKLQAERFQQAAKVLEAQVPYRFLKHISNTAAIVRHPQLQFNMVRLGIGLYGIEPDAEDELQLEPVATLRSTIAQIKHVRKGESVSYNRRGVMHRDSRIATVRIGYADGYSRRFGNGVGKLWLRGRAVPVVGSVCMDMTMVDVTDVPNAKEGDDVIVFGKPLPVQDVAAWVGTIPYEIMTSVSQRVKRVYYYE